MLKEMLTFYVTSNFNDKIETVFSTKVESTSSVSNNPTRKLPLMLTKSELQECLIFLPYHEYEKCFVYLQDGQNPEELSLKLNNAKAACQR